MSKIATEPAAQRLDEFESIVEPASRRLLKQAGVAKSKRVLELGCGTGAMTLWLARQLRPHGVVIALDRSAEALATLAARAQQANLNNIIYKQADLEESLSILQGVDLVYGRFVLMHLRHSASLLCRLFDGLLPGAMLVLEEPAISTFRSQPDRQLWRLCVDLYRRYSSARHIDPDYGGRLLNHVSQAGFCVQANALSFVPLDSIKARKYMALSLMANGQSYVEAGLICRTVLDEWIAALSAAECNDQWTTHFHAVAQLTAQR